MLGAFDPVHRRLLVHTSPAERSTDFVALLDELGAVYGAAGAHGPDRGARQRADPHQQADQQGAGRGPWLTLEWLLKYAPELNDIERGWRDLKQHQLANRTFDDADALARAIPDAVARLNHERQPHPSPIPTQSLGSVEIWLFSIRMPCFKLAMDRFVLTEAQWARMEPHCRGKQSDPGRSGADNRRFVEAVLWIARTGSPWRDLPAFFGRWNTVFKRYRDWVKADIFKRLFDAASDEPDMEYAMVDATIVKVHRHGQGAKRGTASQAIGRSKGGMTTKILALTDALGNLVRFVLLPGQRFDTLGVAPLIEGLEFDAFIADTAFDSNDIIADLHRRGAKVVIAQHPRRATPLQIDTEMYKWRHLIENFFCKLKEFKRIAMRADKTDQSFEAMIHLAAAVINSR